MRQSNKFLEDRTLTFRNIHSREGRIHIHSILDGWEDSNEHLPLISSYFLRERDMNTVRACNIVISDAETIRPF